MDNVTHALAGLLLAEGVVALAARRAPVAGTATGTGARLSTGFRRAALVLGVVAAELPDADRFYAGPVLGMGKLGYLLHHRGHTHTVAFALVGALLAWGVTLAFARRQRAAPARTWLLALAVAGTLSHVALDWTNNYGVHPWWPVSNAWHYGDAVFIVEPWLWIAAIPPLVMLGRGIARRALLGLALLAIIVAAWRVGMAGAGVALVLTLGTLAAFGIAWATGPARSRRQVALGVVAWLVVEAVFATTASLSRATVRRAVGDGMLQDAALTPDVANPLCHNALVVERDGATYRVTRATVAALPSVRTAADCARDNAVPASRRMATAAIRWGEEWSAPVAELRTLAREHCEVAAALRFMRVPAWERLGDGSVRVYDLRYNRGGGGFAEVVVPAWPTACPAHVPPWTPPRQSLIE